jgi:hypothetical protein
VTSSTPRSVRRVGAPGSLPITWPNLRDGVQWFPPSIQECLSTVHSTDHRLAKHPEMARPVGRSPPFGIALHPNNFLRADAHTGDEEVARHRLRTSIQRQYGSAQDSPDCGRFGLDSKRVCICSSRLPRTRFDRRCMLSAPRNDHVSTSYQTQRSDQNETSAQEPATLSDLQRLPVIADQALAPPVWPVGCHANPPVVSCPPPPIASSSRRGLPSSAAEAAWRREVPRSTPPPPSPTRRW